MASVLARMDAEGSEMEQGLADTMKRLDSLQESWRQWLAGRQYDQHLEPRDMPGYIARVLQLRGERNAVEERRKEANALDGYIAEVRGRIAGLGKCFQAMGSAVPEEPDESTIHTLFAALRRAQEKQGEIEALRKDIRSAHFSAEEQRNEMNEAEGRRGELLAHAGSDSEEAFRSLAARWNEREALQTEEFQERKVLLGLFGNEEALRKASEELSSGPPRRSSVSGRPSGPRPRPSKRDRGLGRQVTPCPRDRADRRGRAAQLNCSSSERRRSRSSTIPSSRVLSVYLTKHFLEESKAKHERERQPEVIQRAGLYLSLMTNNKYTLLSEGAGQGLSVVLEEKKPSKKRKGELKWSSGLGDQVYLSMRLALATLWEKLNPSLG